MPKSSYPLINTILYNNSLTINSRSDIIAPNVIDMTGPINGETNIAAVMFGALFSTNPSAANELKMKNNCHI